MTSRQYTRYVPGLLVSLVLLSACDSEPSDPLEAYLWQFERKTGALFDHLEHADEQITLDAAAATDQGILNEDVEVYRFRLVPSAAAEVITHLAAPPRALILALGDQPPDPDWVARFERAVANARATLKDRIASFKASMPTDPASPFQDGPVGQLIVGACARGGAFSASDGCKVNTYAYDEQGALYFYVWRNRQLQRLMIEQILDLDAGELIRSLQAVSRYEGLWYCNNVYDDPDAGKHNEWLSTLTVTRTGENQLGWRMREQFNGMWSDGYGGDADTEANQLVLRGDEGYEARYGYVTDLLSEGQLIRDDNQQRTTSMSVCCPTRHCAEFPACSSSLKAGRPYCR